MPEPGAKPRERALAALRACGATFLAAPAAPLAVTSPIDGEELFDLEGASAADAPAAAERAVEAFDTWRRTAPVARASFSARLGRELDRHRSELAELVVIETGKLIADAAAEVEAAIRACELAADAAGQVAPLPLATGLPRGPFAARRPLGPVAVLGSAERPLLAWAAVAPLALACGCSVVWRPAAPLVAVAVGAVVEAAIQAEVGVGLPGLHTPLLVESDAADALVAHGAIERVVRPEPAAAGVAIVAPSADLDAAARAALTATAAGAGRSPAALRLLLAHESVAAELERRLLDGFRAVRIGDPREPATELGPLRDLDAYRDFLDAVQTVEAEGGELLAGGEARDLEPFPDAYYGEPALVRAPAVLAASPAPILFLATCADLDEALARRDAARPDWSTLFSTAPDEAARFLAAPGSDHGFVAVNACPTEPDLSRPDGTSWLAFTRPVTGRVAD